MGIWTLRAWMKDGKVDRGIAKVCCPRDRTTMRDAFKKTDCVEE